MPIDFETQSFIWLQKEMLWIVPCSFFMRFVCVYVPFHVKFHISSGDWSGGGLGNSAEEKKKKTESSCVFFFPLLNIRNHLCAIESHFYFACCVFRCLFSGFDFPFYALESMRCCCCCWCRCSFFLYRYRRRRSVDNKSKNGSRARVSRDK